MLKITKEMAKEVGVTLTGGPRWVAKYYLVVKDRKVGEGEAEVYAWSVKQARLAICCVEKRNSKCGIKFISCRKEKVELTPEAVDAMNHHNHGCGTAAKKNVGVRILLTGTDTAVLSDKEFKKELAGLVKEAAAIGANGIEVVNNGSLGEAFIELGARMSEGYEKLGLKVWATVVPDGTYGNYFAVIDVGDAPTPTPEPPKPEEPEPELEKESAPVDILEALAQRVSAAEEREEVIDKEVADEAAAEEVHDSVPQDSEPVVVPSAPMVKEETIISEGGNTVSENHSVERASSVEFHAAVRSIIQQ